MYKNAHISWAFLLFVFKILESKYFVLNGVISKKKNRVK